MTLDAIDVAGQKQPDAAQSKTDTFAHKLLRDTLDPILSDSVMLMFARDAWAMSLRFISLPGTKSKSVDSAWLSRETREFFLNKGKSEVSKKSEVFLKAMQPVIRDFFADDVALARLIFALSNQRSGFDLFLDSATALANHLNNHTLDSASARVMNVVRAQDMSASYHIDTIRISDTHYAVSLSYSLRACLAVKYDGSTESLILGESGDFIPIDAVTILDEKGISAPDRSWFILKAQGFHSSEHREGLSLFLKDQSVIIEHARAHGHLAAQYPAEKLKIPLSIPIITTHAWLDIDTSRARSGQFSTNVSSYTSVVAGATDDAQPLHALLNQARQAFIHYEHLCYRRLLQKALSSPSNKEYQQFAAKINQYLQQAQAFCENLLTVLRFPLPEKRWALACALIKQALNAEPTAEALGLQTQVRKLFASQYRVNYAHLKEESLFSDVLRRFSQSLVEQQVNTDENKTLLSIQAYVNDPSESGEKNPRFMREINRLLPTDEVINNFSLIQSIIAQINGYDARKKWEIIRSTQKANDHFGDMIKSIAIISLGFHEDLTAWVKENLKAAQSHHALLIHTPEIILRHQAFATGQIDHIYQRGIILAFEAIVNYISNISGHFPVGAFSAHRDKLDKNEGHLQLLAIAKNDATQNDSFFSGKITDSVVSKSNITNTIDDAINEYLQNLAIMTLGFSAEIVQQLRAQNLWTRFIHFLDQHSPLVISQLPSDIQGIKNILNITDKLSQLDEATRYQMIWNGFEKNQVILTGFSVNAENNKLIQDLVLQSLGLSFKKKLLDENKSIIDTLYSLQAGVNHRYYCNPFAIGLSTILTLIERINSASVREKVQFFLGEWKTVKTVLKTENSSKTRIEREQFQHLARLVFRLKEDDYSFVSKELWFVFSNLQHTRTYLSDIKRIKAAIDFYQESGNRDDLLKLLAADVKTLVTLCTLNDKAPIKGAAINPSTYQQIQMWVLGALNLSNAAKDLVLFGHHSAFVKQNFSFVSEHLLFFKQHIAILDLWTTDEIDIARSNQIVDLFEAKQMEQAGDTDKIELFLDWISKLHDVMTPGDKRIACKLKIQILLNEFCDDRIKLFGHNSMYEDGFEQRLKSIELSALSQQLSTLITRILEIMRGSSENALQTFFNLVQERDSKTPVLSAIDYTILIEFAIAQIAGAARAAEKVQSNKEPTNEFVQKLLRHIASKQVSLDFCLDLLQSLQATPAKLGEMYQSVLKIGEIDLSLSSVLQTSIRDIITPVLRPRLRVLETIYQSQIRAFEESELIGGNSAAALYPYYVLKQALEPSYKADQTIEVLMAFIKPRHKKIEGCLAEWLEKSKSNIKIPSLGNIVDYEAGLCKVASYLRLFKSSKKQGKIADQVLPAISILNELLSIEQQLRYLCNSVTYNLTLRSFFATEKPNSAHLLEKIVQLKKGAYVSGDARDELINMEVLVRGLHEEYGLPPLPIEPSLMDLAIGSVVSVSQTLPRTWERSMRSSSPFSVSQTLPASWGQSALDSLVPSAVVVSATPPALPEHPGIFIPTSESRRELVKEIERLERQFESFFVVKPANPFQASATLSCEQVFNDSTKREQLLPLLAQYVVLKSLVSDDQKSLSVMSDWLIRIDNKTMADFLGDTHKLADSIKDLKGPKHPKIAEMAGVLKQQRTAIDVALDPKSKAHRALLKAGEHVTAQQLSVGVEQFQEATRGFKGRSHFPGFEPVYEKIVRRLNVQIDKITEQLSNTNSSYNNMRRSGKYIGQGRETPWKNKLNALIFIKEAALQKKLCFNAKGELAISGKLVWKQELAALIIDGKALTLQTVDQCTPDKFHLIVNKTTGVRDAGFFDSFRTSETTKVIRLFQDYIHDQIRLEQVKPAQKVRLQSHS